MRIISGKYKNRNIPVNKTSNYRPSTAKFKEALFSILIAGAFLNEDTEVLDLYSGTGAIGFEALSRGAASLTFIDNEPEHINLSKEFARKIGAQDDCTFLTMNAQLLSKSLKQYDLIFMDPPYYGDIVNKTIKSLMRSGWLKEGSIIVSEMHIKDKTPSFDSLEILKEKIYGNNKLVIFRVNLRF
jgi:16S rRNA (guanine966-N2)-methyltransferase